MKRQLSFLLMISSLVLGMTLFGNTADPVPPIPPTDFLSMVLAYIQSFGGISWMLKVSGIITLIIASMKVSFLKDLIWSKLEGFQAWLAPVLGIILGIVSLSETGQLTLAGLLAYFAAGAGSVVLHELLDTIKAIPGLGPIYIAIINAIESALGGDKKKARK